MKRKLSAWLLYAVAAIAVLAALGMAIRLLNPASGTVPIAPTPVTSPSATSSAWPHLDVPTPTVLPGATSSPTPVETTPAPPLMEDINGMPVYVEVRHGNDIVIGADIVPITLEDDGKLVPPGGQAGVYYSQTEWNTVPGNLDTYRGIIAGHNVDGYGNPDVFFRLSEVKRGDVISLTYKLNGTGGVVVAEFTVVADAVSAPKTDVVNSDVEAYRHIWQAAAEPGRYLTVLSCDLATAAIGQHALNNWIVDAIRTK